MTPTPQQIAALAEALHAAHAGCVYRHAGLHAAHAGCVYRHEFDDKVCDPTGGVHTNAAAITLAALDGWTLVPTAEIERLRDIARFIGESEVDDGVDIAEHLRTAFTEMRAAAEIERLRAVGGTSCPCTCCSGRWRWSTAYCNGGCGCTITADAPGDAR